MAHLKPRIFCILAFLPVGVLAESPWSKRTAPSDSTFYTAAWTGKSFVTVGGGRVFKSQDGTTWTVESPAGDVFIHGCMRLGNRLVLWHEKYVNGGTSVWSTSDEVSWQPYVEPGYLGEFTSTYLRVLAGIHLTIRYSGGTVSSPPSVTYLTVDGVSWSYRANTAEMLAVNAATPFGTGFLGVGSSGTILTSTDGGFDWSVVATGVGGNATLTSVATSGSRTVAVGLNGAVVSSSDGTLWVSRNSGTTQRLRSVIWTGTEFVTVGNAGTLLSSPDGEVWTKQESGTTQNLNALAASENVLVAVGDSGTILTTPITGGSTSIGSTLASSKSLTVRTTSTRISVGLPQSLHGQPSRATVYSTAGRTIRQIAVSGNENEISIPIGSITPGRYALEIRGGNERYSGLFQVRR